MSIIGWYLFFAGVMWFLTQTLRFITQEPFPQGLTAWGYDISIHLLWLPLTSAAYTGPAPVTRLVMSLKKLWRIR